MFRRQFLAVSGLSLATALAGCSVAFNGGGTPLTKPTQNVQVGFSNASERTLQFTAAVLPSGLGGLTIRYRDGTERTIDEAFDIDDVPAEAWEGALTFTPLAEDAQVRRFRSTPGSGIGMTFDELPRRTQIVTTVADPALENGIETVAGGTCGDAEVAKVQVEVDQAGAISMLTTCTDEEAQ